MKNVLKLIPIVTLAAIICTGCIKKNTTKGTADPNASQHNQDVQNTKSESDNSNTDINTAVTSSSGFGKNSATEAFSICGATIDTAHRNDASHPYITINFDGQTVCPSPNRIRSGSVKVQLQTGQAWTDQNAQLLVTYNNYKVIFQTLNNASIAFNGTKLLTDVTGINLTSLYLSGGSVQFRERTYNMAVTFENGATASWNDARLTTWAVTPFVASITATVQADSVSGSHNIDSWGQTRWGTNFTTEMQSPWVSGTTCGWWAPISGEYTSTTTNFTVSATFGVNSVGNVVTSGCPGYFKLDWTIDASNVSGSVVLSYF